MCVEPYPPYANILRQAGYEVEETDALQALAFMAEVSSLTWWADGFRVGTILLLDVIEHMQKEEGRAVLDLACRLATVQVVVYTPFGFVEQTEDAWGLGGEWWQTHRSGWEPDDFPGWKIETYTPARAASPEGFYALWQPHP